MTDQYTPDGAALANDAAADLAAVFTSPQVAADLKACAPSAYGAAALFWSSANTRPALSPRMRELVLVALHGTISSLNGEALRRHVGRALEAGTWAIDAVQTRDFAADKHRTVDDTPAGGGAGMVLRVDVLAAAVDHARQNLADRPVIALTPRGKPLTQARVRELAAGPGVILLCGRFEGFDERIFEGRGVEEVSVGDIVLSGGEPAALMLLDACIRLLPGVMGASSSGDEESFEQGLLEYPHYTRPNDWEGRMIPEVLRSGDHAKIAAWRKHQAEEITRLRRPDLWGRYKDARVQPASNVRQKNKD